MKPLRYIIFILLMVAFFSYAYADVRLNTLAFSKHHSNHDYNESHHGLGISYTTDKEWTFGYMHYRNSFGDASNIYYVARDLYQIGDVNLGAGGGLVTGYDFPAGAWVSARYKWLVISHVPFAVTTIGLSIPLN